MVRGADETGADLVIARDYIARGMRSRAEDLVALELGPKPERDIQAGLEREATADRWTRLDREIKSRLDEVGLLDLRPERPGPDDPFIRRQMIRRLNFLEAMGLAVTDGAGQWVVEAGAERRLRALGLRYSPTSFDRLNRCGESIDVLSERALMGPTPGMPMNRRQTSSRLTK